METLGRDRLRHDALHDVERLNVASSTVAGDAGRHIGGTHRRLPAAYSWASDVGEVQSCHLGRASYSADVTAPGMERSMVSLF